MIFTDLLYVPIFLSLYRALREINKNAMALAVALAGLFIALDRAVTWTTYSVLIMSGGNYAAATIDAQPAVYVAAASYPSAVLESPLPGIYSMLIPSLGVLTAGLVMLKGVFNRITAYLALATDITGILFVGSVVVSSLDVVRIINALLATAWYLLVGIRLYRLGRK